MTFTVGVGKIVCTCDREMERTGGVFGCKETSDTYYCRFCQKYVIVITPGKELQEAFVRRVEST